MQPAAALVAQHIPRLRRYARALTGERTRADDLVQDTLERALRKLHLWRAGSDLRAWLFTVMHNVHVNQVRSRAYGAEEATDPEELHPPVREGDADAGDVMDLEAALARLADEQREVLLLVGLEQLTYQEAAAVLGIPIGTVMSRLSRARERLRTLLEGADSGSVTLKVVK